MLETQTHGHCFNFVDNNVKVWGVMRLRMSITSRRNWSKYGLVWSSTLSTLVYVPENGAENGTDNGPLNTPLQDCSHCNISSGSAEADSG